MAPSGVTNEPHEDLAIVFTRYLKAFSEPPPLAAWVGSDADLYALLDTAIRSGRHLDEDAVARAMGLDPAPAGTLI